MIKLLSDLIIFLNILTLAYFSLANLISFTLISLAGYNIFYYKVRRKIAISKKKDFDLLPGISIISVAFNRSETVLENIESLRNINYPDYEIIIVNDGSKDKTLELIKKRYELVRIHRASSENLKTEEVKEIYKSALDQRITVIDKTIGGVADSLNCGINYSRHKLICTIDAYSILESNALLKMIQPYLERTAKIIGLTGSVKVANGCKIKNGEVKEVGLPRKILPILQVSEYTRVLYCDRAGWSTLNCLINTMGSFGIFEKKYVLKVGGYNSKAYNEHLELVLKLHKYFKNKKRKYKILFIPDTYCWSRIPEYIKTLESQRKRWYTGIVETIMENKDMILNPKYGTVGMIACPYYFLFEIVGPAIELFSYILFLLGIILGKLSLKFIIIYISLVFVLRIFISLTALLLEEISEKNYDRPNEIFKILLIAIYENIGYRQLILWWKFKSLIKYLRKKYGK